VKHNSGFSPRTVSICVLYVILAVRDAFCPKHRLVTVGICNGSCIILTVRKVLSDWVIYMKTVNSVMQLQQTLFMHLCMRMRYCNAVLPRQLLMHISEACNRNNVIQAKTWLAACTEPKTKSLTSSGSYCLPVRLSLGKTMQITPIERYSYGRCW
jgi:hypothetical protein